MNSQDAIKVGLDMAWLVCTSYLDDMSDEELMKRPTEGCNHIKWQIGHLISSDQNLLNTVLPGAAPELPEGFADRYAKETASSDEAAEFDSKEDLLKLANEQHAAYLNAVASISEDDLDKESPEPLRQYAPTVASVLSLHGSHWMMHSGQWAVVRRMLGRPPLF